jgi:superfamily I DNA/RNA helicase
MILDFVKSDKSPKFDVVFIDEAQDLSRMQWDMVNHFNTKILLLQAMMIRLSLDGPERM